MWLPKFSKSKLKQMSKEVKKIKKQKKCCKFSAFLESRFCILQDVSSVQCFISNCI